MVSLDLSVAVVLGVDVGKEEVGDALHRALELLHLVRVRLRIRVSYNPKPRSLEA